MDLDVVAGAEPVTAAAAGADVLDAVDEQLIARLAGRARAGGLQLAGEGGLLAQLTKRLVESALEGELTDHLGYDRHEVAGRDGGNSRNGRRSKTVLTEVGPVEIDVPRDRDATFEPKIVPKRQRRLSEVDELVISLSAKGLTTGEVQAHLAEVYAPTSRAGPSRRSPRRSSRAWPSGRTGRWTRGGVSGCVHRRDQRQDPRREGGQPAHLRRARGDLRGPPRHPRALGRGGSLGHRGPPVGEGAKYWLHVLTEIKNRLPEHVRLIERTQPRTT